MYARGSGLNNHVGKCNGLIEVADDEENTVSIPDVTDAEKELFSSITSCFHSRCTHKNWQKEFASARDLMEHIRYEHSDDLAFLQSLQMQLYLELQRHAQCKTCYCPFPRGGIHRHALKCQQRTNGRASTSSSYSHANDDNDDDDEMEVEEGGEEVKDDGDFIHLPKQSIKMKSWAETEISAFMNAFREHGRKWSAVAAHMRTRTANACASFYHSRRHTYQLDEGKANEKLPKAISSLQKRARRDGVDDADVDGDDDEAEENTNVSSIKKQRTSLLSSASSSAPHQTESFFQTLEQSCQKTIDVLMEELTAIRSLKANALNVRKQNEAVLRDATIAISKSILPAGEQFVETTYHSFDEAIEALRKAKQALAESMLVDTQIHENMKRTQVQLQSTINLHIQYEQRAPLQQSQTQSHSPSPSEQTSQQSQSEQQEPQPLQSQAQSHTQQSSMRMEQLKSQIQRQQQSQPSQFEQTSQQLQHQLSLSSQLPPERQHMHSLSPIPQQTQVEQVQSQLPWHLQSDQPHSKAGSSQQMFISQSQRPLQRYTDLIQSSIRSLSPSPASPLPASEMAVQETTVSVTPRNAPPAAAVAASRVNSVIVPPLAHVTVNNTAKQLSQPTSPSIFRNGALLHSIGLSRNS